MVKPLFGVVQSIHLHGFLRQPIVSDLKIVDILPGLNMSVFLYVFIFSINFLSEFWLSQRAVGSALIFMWMSVSAAQQGCSGIFWGSVRTSERPQRMTCLFLRPSKTTGHHKIHFIYIALFKNTHRAQRT